MKRLIALRLAWLVSIALAGIFMARAPWIGVAQAHAKTYVIDQKNTAFVPRRLVVPRGATVVFENHDVTEHNVTLAIPRHDKTLNVDLGTFPPGQKVSYTFEQPGTVRVHCKIHAQMTATITVR